MNQDNIFQRIRANFSNITNHPPAAKRVFTQSQEKNTLFTLVDKCKGFVRKIWVFSIAGPRICVQIPVPVTLCVDSGSEIDFVTGTTMENREIYWQ